MFTKFNLFESYISIEDEKYFIDMIIKYNKKKLKNEIDFEMYIIGCYYNPQRYGIQKPSPYYSAIEWCKQDIEYSYNLIQKEIRMRNAKNKSKKFNL